MTAKTETPEIALYVTHAGGWDGGYRVVFEGADADARAAAWIAAHPRDHVDLAEDFDWAYDDIRATAEALDPTCEHGLSSRSCGGPGHWVDR